MDAEIQKRFAALENEIKDLKSLLSKEAARLDKRITDDENGTVRYIESHCREHGEITRMLWASYAKTHPEAIDTLIQCDKILGTDAPGKTSR